MLGPGLQRAQTPTALTLNKLLLVEGQDAFHIFNALLRHLGLDADIQVHDFGGVSNFRGYLRTVRSTPGFGEVVSIGIIRDAEQDASAAFDSIRGSLQAATLPHPRRAGVRGVTGPPRVAVFILPDCKNPGMLETLCLRAVVSDPALTCVRRYFACLKSRGLPLPRNPAKAEVLAFLASRPVVQRQIGIAAYHGHWPWRAPAFARVIRFLKSL